MNELYSMEESGELKLFSKKKHLNSNKGSLQSQLHLNKVVWQIRQKFTKVYKSRDIKVELGFGRYYTEFRYSPKNPYRKIPVST